MCRALDILITCPCGRRAEAFERCPRDISKDAAVSSGCWQGIANRDCDTIFVGTDYLRDATYLCGVCACYVSAGVVRYDCSPFDLGYIRACMMDPVSVVDHMVKSIFGYHRDVEEDGATSGYINTSGEVVTIVCLYRDAGEMGAIATYRIRG